MSLKKLVESTAEAAALEACKEEIMKAIQVMGRQTGSGIGTIKRVKSHDSFVVEVNGREQDLTFTGQRALGSDGKVIIDAGGTCR